MSLTKVNYIDNSTIITAKNLNDIQDNIIELNKLEDKVIYGKGKNLLKNTAKSETRNGITFTVNEDGSVTLSGTATNTTIFVIGYISVKAGTDYICNSGNDLLRYSFRLEDGNTVVHDFSANNTYIPDSDNRYTVCIRVGNGKTVNETSYPMICLASETDYTYEPYYEGLKDTISKSQIVNNFTTTEKGFVADARAIAVLHDAVFPDYDGASYIDSGTFGASETKITRTITAEEDCFVNARVYTNATAAQSDILVTTTGGYVVSYAKMVASAKYVHLTTAVFPLRKGQTVTFTINSASGNTWGISKF